MPIRLRWPGPQRIKRRSLVSAARVTLLVLMVSTSVSRVFAYSVLTHEEIVDLLWLDEIRPLLVQRFPSLTPDQIKEAHAYAYGGAVIQDLGYYPFGSAEFSDLAHYVRTGDFVRELIRESSDANEYAFALGALAHYSSDITGHPAVNESVAIEYPKLRAKYGNVILYAENKTAHLKTEFGFDMVQVAKSRYAPQQYHDFIGFEVSEPLLDRVFPVVYGVQIKDVMSHEDLAIGTYRWAISRLIPEMTQVALATRKKEMTKEHRDFEKKKFLYRLSRSDYEREWGKQYTHPGTGARIVAIFIRLIPKIGPFKALGFNNPTPHTEDLYFKSINATVDQYRFFLRSVGSNTLRLPNCDLDSGRPTRVAEYSLADDTYAKLLDRLSSHDLASITPDLRKNILDFYSTPEPSLESRIEIKKDPRSSKIESKKLQNDLDQLRAMSPAEALTPVRETLLAAPAPNPAVCTIGQ